MTSPAKGSSSIAETTRINDFVSISRPLEDSYDPGSPSLIIIFGWFKAKLSHVSKYVDDFHRLYPTSTIVVIESQFAWLYQAQHTRESFLEPVAEILEHLQSSEGSRFRGVFLHVMSNGGAVQLMTLTKVLAKRTRPTNTRFPIALVLDSTPDASTLRCLTTGISAGFRNPLFKLAAAPAVLLLYSVFRFTYGITTPLLPEVRQHLNSPTLIPFYRNPARYRDGTLIGYSKILASADVAQEVQWIPRLYVCSKVDEITDFNAVQTHVEEARRAGLDARVEVYEKSPHVSHARTDPERYWTAVQQLWRDARQRAVSAKL